MSTNEESDIQKEHPAGIASSPSHGKRQFSLVALLSLQGVAAVAVFIAKSLGIEYLIAAIIILVMMAVPVMGCVWVASNFQRAERLFSKIVVAYWAIYLLAAAASFLGLWQFLD